MKTKNRMTTTKKGNTTTQKRMTTTTVPQVISLKGMTQVQKDFFKDIMIQSFNLSDSMLGTMKRNHQTIIDLHRQIQELKSGQVCCHPN